MVRREGTAFQARIEKIRGDLRRKIAKRVGSGSAVCQWLWLVAVISSKYRAQAAFSIVMSFNNTCSCPSGLTFS